MNNNKILSLTLLAFSLIFTSLGATQLGVSNHVKENSISSRISAILKKRGVDEDAAENISSNFIDGDEELFMMMINNLENGCDVLKKNEILEYLSILALHKQSINLDSYSSLVGMVYKIKSEPLSKKTLKELENIATINSLYLQSFAA